MTRVLRFDGKHLVASPDPLRENRSPDLADSFLFRAGKVRAWREHKNRFFHDLRQFDQNLASQLDAFYLECASELADEYEAFPRFELVNDSLWLRVRPVPVIAETTTAVTTTQEFRNASRKGPNIGVYGALNAEHQCETIRLSANGSVLEGVTSSLLWWRDDNLHYAPKTDRVTSTTEQFLLNAAMLRNIESTPEILTPKELINFETWVVNALHGIRVLTSIDNKPLPNFERERLELFKADFERSWLPLGDTSTL